jgi:hypothetical protein
VHVFEVVIGVEEPVGARVGSTAERIGVRSMA